MSSPRLHRSLKNTSILMEVLDLSETQAFLSSEEAGQLTWPLDQLPEGIQKGDTVTIHLSPSEMPETEQTPQEFLQTLIG